MQVALHDDVEVLSGKGIFRIVPLWYFKIYFVAADVPTNHPNVAFSNEKAKIEGVALQTSALLLHP